MMIFHPKWLSQIKGTGVNKKPILKKPVNIAIKPYIKQTLDVNGVTQPHEKNNKHFYVPQNDTLIPLLKKKGSLKWVQRNQKPQQPPLSLPLCSPGSG